MRILVGQTYCIMGYITHNKRGTQYNNVSAEIDAIQKQMYAQKYRY